LKGLEVSEVKLSEVIKDNATFRFDAEYFKKIYLSFGNITNTYQLGELVEDGYRVVYGETKVIEDKTGKLPFFLQASDIETPFCKKDNLHNVCEQDWIKYPKGQIKYGELLIEVKGKIEKVAIVPDDFPEHTLVSGSLYKMTLNEKMSKYMLLTYLISKYGVSFKQRFQTNLLIPYISKPDLYKIPVPKFSILLQNTIDEIYACIFKNNAKSKSLYTAAEDLLLSELGLKNWQPKNENINVKTLKESFLSSGRLDAEYYQSKYDEIENAIKAYKGGYDLIKNQFTQNVDVCDYSEKAYNYIEIGDINTGDGSASYNLVETNDLPDNAKRVVYFGDILISKVRPYRGAVAIINFEVKNLIASGAFTTLHEKSDYKKEVLQVLLRTQIYKEWLLKWNVGSSYPVIDEDILNLPIPMLQQETQKKIAELIQTSFALRQESKRLLEEAKMMVEHEIEKGDE